MNPHWHPPCKHAEAHHLTNDDVKKDGPLLSHIAKTLSWLLTAPGLTEDEGQARMSQIQRTNFTTCMWQIKTGFPVLSFELRSWFKVQGIFIHWEPFDSHPAVINRHHTKKSVQQQIVNIIYNFKVSFTRLIAAGIDDFLILFGLHHGRLYLRPDGSNT